MIHPNLGKHDLSKKKFYRIIYVVVALTFVAVTVALWFAERGVV